MTTTPASLAGRAPLGGRTVARLGLGAMRLSQRGTAFDAEATPVALEEAVGVVRRAVELGVDHVDTAAFYFSAGLSANEVLAEALHDGDGVLVATKVGPTRTPDGAWGARATPGELRGQVLENLRTLRRAHLDLVNYRVQDPDGSVRPHLEALLALREEGLVVDLGVSGVSMAQLEEACRVAPIACVQNAHGLERRDDDAILERCEELGVAFVPFFSIAGTGRHHGPVGPEPAALEAVASAHGATTAQVRLAWALARGPHVLVIPGTSSRAHLEENVAAAALHLGADELALLDDLDGPRAG